MPTNLLSTIRTKANNDYELYDDSVVSSNDYVRCLYHFRSKGSLVSLRPGAPRHINEHNISQAIISADSFKDAIGWLERDYSIDDGTLWTVEFIGYDNRDRDADRYLMTYTRVS